MIDRASNKAPNLESRWFMIGVFFGVFFLAVTVGIGKNGEYDGITAEEWADEYYATLSDYSQCESDLGEIQDVVDEDLIELGECVERNKDFYRDVIQTCEQSSRFTQQQCLTIALRLVDGYNESLRECVASYLP